MCFVNYFIMNHGVVKLIQLNLPFAYEMHELSFVCMRYQWLKEIKMLAGSCGSLSVEVKYRNAGAAVLGFYKCSEGEMDLNFRYNHRTQGCRWHDSEQPLNVCLIDFRPGIEAQLHIHTTIKVLLHKSFHNSSQHLVESHAHEAASEQHKGKCFNMFSVRVYFMTSFSES